MQISGQVDKETAQQAITMLKSRGIPVKPNIDDLKDVRGFFPGLETTLISVAALATILTFVRDILTSIKKKSLSSEDLENQAENKLRELLKAFGVTDFEVLEISNLHGLLRHPASNSKIVLRDLSENRDLMVTITRAGRVNISLKEGNKLKF